MILNLKLN